MKTTIVVNDFEHQIPIEQDRSLLEFLRDDLGLLGSKFGCGEGACGACTVMMGRTAVSACRVPLAEAAGSRVTTVEGLASDGLLHPVQQAWLELGAMQCGYCVPGWLVGVAALLARTPHPDDEQIVATLEGHLCRCCTYPRILRAVHRAAELMEAPESLWHEQAPDGPASSAAAGGDAALLEGAIELADAAPLDLTTPDERPFFERLPPGLVAVATAPESSREDAGWKTTRDAWVHVAESGAVTAFTGKVEGGQGTRTALSVLVAEELAVPVSSVRLVMGDTDLSPYDAGTFGSRSMPDAAPALRTAAVRARQCLCEMAAVQLGLEQHDLEALDGAVVGPGGHPRITFGELLTGVSRVETVPTGGALSLPSTWQTSGRPRRALGAIDIVTGRRRYPSDLSLAGMWHGCVLRPPSHGSTLESVDTTAAAAVAGASIVREGSFVGTVAADHRTARQALRALEATWSHEPQPGRDELETYLRSHLVSGGEGWNGPFEHAEGDLEAALESAATTVRATYTTAYIAHVPLEPRVAVAQWSDDRLTVWTGTQTPFAIRRQLAEALQVPEETVHVIVPDFGGGFGGKHTATAALEAARFSRAVGRPVKVQWSRWEEFHAGYLRPAAVIDAASGADSSGALTAWSFTNLNGGSAGVRTPYRVPNQRVAYQPAASPLPQGPYRGVAATANHFARESHMDELAHRLGADPLELRLRHLDDTRLAAVFRAAAQQIGWGSGAQAPHVGLGIAGGFEKGGRVATAAVVRVDDDGTLQVERLVTAFDCGGIVNPDNLENQVEGAALMALGGALFEAVEFDDGRVTNASLSAYRVPRLTDVPKVEVVLVDQPAEQPAGAGETPMVAVAPAIANAIFRASGVRLRSMPLAPRGIVTG